MSINTDKGKHLNLFTSKPKTKNKVSNKAFDMMTAAADKTAVELFPAEFDKSTKGIHNALMVAGMTPALGNVADLTDATLYALEGEFGDAAWASAAAIPFIGQMVAGKKALKIAKESGEEMVTLYRGIPDWVRGEMVKKGKYLSPKQKWTEKGEGLWASGSKRYSEKLAEGKGVVLEFEMPRTEWKKLAENRYYPWSPTDQWFEPADIKQWIKGGIDKVFLKRVHRLK